VVQPLEADHTAGGILRQSTESTEDLSSLICALLEAESSSATQTMPAQPLSPPPASMELELASVQEGAKATAATIANVRTPKQRKQTCSKPVAENCNQALVAAHPKPSARALKELEASSVRERTKATAATIANVKAPKQRKQKRAMPVAEEDCHQVCVAAQAQQLHAARLQQAQAAMWQAHVQRAVVAQQWQALAARNPQYAMAAAQTARMQQAAMYHQMAMRAGHGAC
jgi:hypothetical protein